MRFMAGLVVILLFILLGIAGPAFSTPKYIESILPSTTLYGPHNCLEIWAEINEPDNISIDRVWVEIYPSGSDEPAIIDLANADNDDKYSSTYCEFNQKGYYDIVIHAKDDNGEETFPKVTYVKKLTMDEYEPDDEWQDATIIAPNDPTPQKHNFHDAEDADWVILPGVAEINYTLRADNLNPLSNAVVEIYDTDGTRVLKKSENDDSTAGLLTSLDWTCPKDGMYPVKISNHNPQYFGANICYDFEIYNPSAGNDGHIKGKVYHVVDKTPIDKALVKMSDDSLGASDANGNYAIFGVPPSMETSYKLTATADDYQQYEKYGITLSQTKTIKIDIPMIADEIEIIEGDLNHDGKIDMEDLILCLQTVAGMDVSASFYADANADGRIGLEEAIFIIRRIVIP